MIITYLFVKLDLLNATGVTALTHQHVVKVLLVTKWVFEAFFASSVLKIE